jgi:hypothetical protein
VLAQPDTEVRAPAHISEDQVNGSDTILGTHRLEYNALKAGLSLAPLSLTMFAVAIVAGKKAAEQGPAGIIRAGFAILTAGLVLLIPSCPGPTPAGGWRSR